MEYSLMARAIYELMDQPVQHLGYAPTLTNSELITAITNPDPSLDERQRTLLLELAVKRGIQVVHV